MNFSTPVVGETGTVYAVEVDERLVSKLEQRVAESTAKNIQVVLATAEDTRLEPASLDAALLVDVYHEMSNQASVLKGLHRALRPTGKLLIMDYITEELEGRPRDTQQVDHAISPSFLVEDLEQAGFHVDRVINPLNENHPDGITAYVAVSGRGGSGE